MAPEAMTLTSRDGTRLHATRTRAGTARGGVVFQHGYADHSGRYQHVFDALAAAGFDVIAPDLRGHGRSAGARGKLEDIREYLDDLGAGLDAMRAAGHARPFLLAHSMGALVALRLMTDAERAPRDLAGLVVTSPFLGINPDVSPVKVAAAGVLARLVPNLPLSNEISPTILTHDEEMIAARRADTLCFSHATPAWLRLIRKTQSETVSAMPRLNVPSLWFVAGEDKLVDARTTERAFAQAGFADKTLVPCPTSYHEVLMETDRAVTIGQMIEWFSKYI